MIRFLPLVAILTLIGDPAELPEFRNISAESGLAFRFDPGSRGKHDLPEIMGGGVGLIDLDGDGDLDVYLCNGGPIAPDPDQPDPPCRLFRNDGKGRFSDVTEKAGAPGPSYAMGVAVGDFDGDGRDDLLVTGWRDQRLYMNLGGGRFSDVTEKAGLRSKLWSTSAAFADLDGDGDLDLYVCNYVEYDPEKAPESAAPDGKRDYCGPEEFPAQPDRLYRNNGDATFTDVSGEAGIHDLDGRGLGVIVADLVGDARPDIFVANDGSPCRLYENRGGLRFVEVGQESGVALDGDGQALAGMGVACGDIDGDGLVDLAVTNFLGRSTVAFLNAGKGRFADHSAAIGLTAATRSVLGFGLALEDFDGDGKLDLMQANGHVLDRARLGQPLAMKPTLLRGDQGRFRIVPPREGDPFSKPILGRGLATGDLDGDGRPDAIVAAIDGPPLVLRNGSKGRFAAFECISKAGLPAVGATVRARVGERTVVCPVAAGGSYLSSPGRALSVGLDGAERIKLVDVTWPSGKVERFTPGDGPGVHRIREGAGEPRP